MHIARAHLERNRSTRGKEASATPTEYRESRAPWRNRPGAIVMSPLSLAPIVTPHGHLTLGQVDEGPTLDAGLAERLRTARAPSTRPSSFCRDASPRASSRPYPSELLVPGPGLESG